MNWSRVRISYLTESAVSLLVLPSLQIDLHLYGHLRGIARARRLFRFCFEALVTLPGPTGSRINFVVGLPGRRARFQ